MSLTPVESALTHHRQPETSAPNLGSGCQAEGLQDSLSEQNVEHTMVQLEVFKGVSAPSQGKLSMRKRVAPESSGAVMKWQCRDQTSAQDESRCGTSILGLRQKMNCGNYSYADAHW
jgi:hypothetical protein